MREISHTNPYTGEPAGQFFSRGPIVRADGGRPATSPERPRANGGPTAEDDEAESSDDRNAETADDRNVEPSDDRNVEPSDDRDTETAERGESRTRMRDIDHTPPKDAADANRVFERGGREETVESEE